MKIVILLGAPGSGKGTVASRLAASDSLFRHVSSGDLLREAVRLGTPAGREAEGYMKRGELVSDALIGQMIVEQMGRVEEPCTWLLDGFPRTVAQAEMLAEITGQRGAEVVATVLLEVDDEILVDRIAGRRACPKCGAGYHVKNIPPRTEGICDKCGAELIIRKDDNPETVKNRLAVYREQTFPLIEFYSTRGKLRKVVGTGPIEGIVERVRQAMA